MGPSRKRPRTTPPTVDESESTKPADGRSKPTQPSTTVADNCSKAPNSKDEAPIRLKNPINDIKAGGDSTKNVSIPPAVGPDQKAVADAGK
jgi:hypothetical protein